MTLPSTFYEICDLPESERMDVLLQRLVEATADHEELVPGDRAPVVAALHVGNGAEVAPPAKRGQEVGDVVGDAVAAEPTHLDHGLLHPPGVDEHARRHHGGGLPQLSVSNATSITPDVVEKVNSFFKIVNEIAGILNLS